MLTPLGCGVRPSWEALIASQSGIGAITSFDTSELTCRVAAEIKRGVGPNLFNPDDWVPPKEQKKMDDFILFAMAAASVLRPLTVSARCAAR